MSQLDELTLPVKCYVLNLGTQQKASELAPLKFFMTEVRNNNYIQTFKIPDEYSHTNIRFPVLIQSFIFQ